MEATLINTKLSLFHCSEQSAFSHEQVLLKAVSSNDKQSAISLFPKAGCDPVSTCTAYTIPGTFGINANLSNTQVFLGLLEDLKQNFNGSNTFETMKICSRER